MNDTTKKDLPQNEPEQTEDLNQQAVETSDGEPSAEAVEATATDHCDEPAAEVCPDDSAEKEESEEVPAEEEAEEISAEDEQAEEEAFADEENEAFYEDTAADETWEEAEESTGFKGRFFSASTSLAKWLILVLILLTLLLAGSLFTLYQSVSMDDLPKYTVAWAGQPLEISGYDWSVPVAGRWLDRNFKKPASSQPQTLELVEESHPQLSLPEYVSTHMEILDETGALVFEGNHTDYNDFSFSENGSYTATLTVGSIPSQDKTRQIEGSYTYSFGFELQAKPTLSLSSNAVAQGSIIGVRLSGLLGDVPPTLTTELADIPFTYHQGSWVAYIPVDYNQMAGDYEITASLNQQTVTETVRVYGRQRRELDSHTLDGTAAVPYVGKTPKDMTYLWEINDPDVYWTDSFIQPIQGRIIRDYAVLEYIDRLDPNDPLLALVPPELIAAYNVNIAPRRSINVTLATRSGTPVVAPAAGRVVYAASNGGLGRVVAIEHGCGVKSLFYLLGRRDVDEGDFVTQGQQIGAAQSHIICEMRVGDIPVNPWDAWRGSGGLFF